MTRRYGRPFLFSVNKILNDSPKKVTKFHDVLQIKMVDFGLKEILENLIIFDQKASIITHENDEKIVDCDPEKKLEIFQIS